jgi:hypothetical protein
MLRFIPAWAGIPTWQWPCTHYQLLDISPDEQDPKVIEEAALARAAHLRAYQITCESECDQLLQALARALITLLDPARRSAYDQALGVPAGPVAAASAATLLVPATGGDGATSPPCDVLLVFRPPGLPPRRRGPPARSSREVVRARQGLPARGKKWPGAAVFPGQALSPGPACT